MIEIVGPDGDVWDRADRILGTIRDCAPTESGWRGVMPDGRAITVRSAHPGVRADMPGGAGWLLKARAPEDGRLHPFVRDARGRGLYLIEAQPAGSRRPGRPR